MNHHLSYALNFTEPINFKFIEDAATTHTNVDTEYFIIRIGPNSKNITLIDPDDQLLIDTDFDGAFETGIIDMSSSEIRFRFNPSPSGTTPFQFVASRVTDVIFEHHSANGC